MASQHFAVSTSLSIENFDDRRTARRRVRDVMAELRRLSRVDDRLVRATSHMGRRSTLVTIELTIAASSGAAAFDIGAATLRASIHAAGGSTAGWGEIRPTGTGLHESWSAAAAAASNMARISRQLPRLDALETPVASGTRATGPGRSLDVQRWRSWPADLGARSWN